MGLNHVCIWMKDLSCTTACAREKGRPDTSRLSSTRLERKLVFITVVYEVGYVPTALRETEADGVCRGWILLSKGLRPDPQPEALG